MRTRGLYWPLRNGTYIRRLPVDIAIPDEVSQGQVIYRPVAFDLIGDLFSTASGALWLSLGPDLVPYSPAAVRFARTLVRRSYPRCLRRRVFRRLRTAGRIVDRQQIRERRRDFALVLADLQVGT